MKKRAICALSAALAFCSAAAGAESDRETLYFKADSHEMIVTAEEISRNEYNEAAYDIRVTMDGKQTQTINFTSENTNAGEREVYPCDVNMDGYTDLALLNSMGASDGFASYYVYDPAAGEFVYHPELERLSFYRAQFYPRNRYVLNDLHDSAATGIWELYQWQPDGAFRLIAEASIQFTDDVNSGELIAKAGPVQNGVVRLTYTGEPFDYEDEPRRQLEYAKLMELLFDGADPGESVELGMTK